MSVIFIIEWKDRADEVIRIGSHALAKDYWAPLAAELGLELIPQFYSFLPVEPADLGPLLAELDSFQSELVRQGGYEESIEKVDRLSNAFRGKPRCQFILP
jgi:hypothetical protein